ncbi:branched-chain amino acid ABC transporter permease [Terrabacter tumescens]|uniref:Branched-chain amino acid ABC transporter permease n=1 Tax=Terrabacter tumescens TaxID=60443 RepID=A0ABQ2HW77_9MICO|nr:branched-chain amino acid ABC transporter permease [Terrabacter tumescens]GGM90709.1 branched-chain amino acid ABC transporter permease [Terrabacter tumescens]
MSEQMTAKVDVDLAQPSILSRRNPLRYVMLLAGLAVVVMLPYWIYPPVAMDILCWGLFAISVDLLLGFTGLLSFGHAAFWGGSAYCTGLIATHWGVPFPVAVLGGAVFSMLIAWPIGYLSVRRTGIYFAMVTLAFAQMLYFIANQARDLTGGENGLQGIPRNFFGIELVETDPFYFYYVGAVLILIGILLAWRVVNSPFGRVLTAVRDNPARARALGYDVERYKITVFVISAGLAGLAGGVFAVSHQFASLQELMWTTSGKVVLVTVLGGIGTLWGGLVGAGVVVTLEDFLASSGFEGIGLITGTIFVVIVLLFRHGIWGTGRNVLRRYVLERRQRSRD